MADVTFLVYTAVFFAASIGLVYLFENIRERQ